MAAIVSRKSVFRPQPARTDPYDSLQALKGAAGETSRSADYPTGRMTPWRQIEYKPRT